MKKFAALLFCLLTWGAPGGAARAQDKIFTNSLGMEFVLIPAGKFSGGMIKNDFGEEVQRVVTISRTFYLGKYEVTQEQWVAVMGEGSNLSDFKGRTNPVERVSWEDVQVFIQKLNEKEGVKKYRLPTEAEWEHAARAGSATEYFWGDDPGQLGQYAWFDENSKESTRQVGEKQPNPWGLYDIYGNVWEWVEDWYGEYQEGVMIDPTGAVRGSPRVGRGGGWDGDAEDCRSAARVWDMPDNRSNDLGFRVAFSPGQ